MPPEPSKTPIANIRVSARYFRPWDTDKAQIHDLQLTINHVDCDLVLCATPVDLQKLLSINKPIIKVGYEYKDHGNPLLKDVLLNRLQKLNKSHDDET